MHHLEEDVDLLEELEAMDLLEEDMNVLEREVGISWRGKTRFSWRMWICGGAGGRGSAGGGGEGSLSMLTLLCCSIPSRRINLEKKSSLYVGEERINFDVESH